MHRSGLLLILVALLAGVLFWLIARSGGAGELDGRASSRAVAAEPLPHRIETNATDELEAREALPRVAGADAQARAVEHELPHLDVRVVRSGDKVPLTDMPIEVTPIGPRGEVAGPVIEGRTDALGRATLAVPAGTRLHVRVPLRREHGTDMRDLAPLAAGERRAVELFVRVATRLVFHGRAVADEDGAPLAGARVGVREVDERGAVAFAAVSRTDVDGRFERAASTLRPIVLELIAEGRAPLRFTASAEHGTPELARELRLSRLARLLVRVPDAGGRALRVRASTSSQHLAAAGDHGSAGNDLLVWTGELGLDDAALLEGLLPEAPLSLTLSEGEEVLRRVHGLSLSPGETRELVLRLAGAGVSGRVLLGNGEPLASHRIVVVQRGADEDAEQRLFVPERAPAHVAHAETCAEGRFELASLPAGSYWIGPARGRADVPLLHARLDVADDLGARHVELTLPEPRWIRGRVVLPAGAHFANSLVFASSAEPLLRAAAPCEPDGRFELGPLIAGEYVLEAKDARGRSSSPSPIAAGTQDVVLHALP